MAGLAQAQDLPKPLTPADFIQFDPAEVRLGRLLFFDPLLSGNRNISCATCHNPAFGTSDGLALGVGEGGIGAGMARQGGSARVLQSRNTPGLWNLGAKGVRRLFHDGRVEISGTGYANPAGAQLPDGLNSLLAVQALFPLIARSEMAGDPAENDIALAAQDNVQKAWGLIADRVAATPRYSRIFGDKKVDISAIVNGIAAFVATEYRTDNTAFDRYLLGDITALDDAAHQGMTLFFGTAGCSRCHSGSLLSDQSFHALGLPQFGPGLTRRFDPVARDVGRLAVSDDLADAYRFRTPFLRNVVNTAPYGHNGAFANLRDMLRHHANPTKSLLRWTPRQVDLVQIEGTGQDEFALIMDTTEDARVQHAVQIEQQRFPPRPLTEQDITLLLAFLASLSPIH